MADTTKPDCPASAINFRAAETSAARNGLLEYGSWRAGLERRHTVMPRWYWDEQECRRHYVAHNSAAIDWQERERRLNRGNAAFHRILTGPI